MKQPIVLIGGGGHCKACIDVIETADVFTIAGIVDSKDKLGSILLGYKFFATDDDLHTLSKSYRNFLITVGQIKSPTIRETLSRKISELGGSLPSVISPKAHVSMHASIGRGTIVMHNAVINAGAKVGEGCIINTGALIEHDVVVGSFSHISTGVCINGGAAVGEGCFIGSNSTLKEGVILGGSVVVGAHSLVLSSCAEPGTYWGIPAKKAR